MSEFEGREARSLHDLIAQLAEIESKWAIAAARYARHEVTPRYTDDETPTSYERGLIQHVAACYRDGWLAACAEVAAWIARQPQLQAWTLERLADGWANVLCGARVVVAGIVAEDAEEVIAAHNHELKGVMPSGLHVRENERVLSDTSTVDPALTGAQHPVTNTAAPPVIPTAARPQPFDPQHELNAWRELGEEMGRVVSLMPKEQFEDWFPDWFGPRLFDLQVAAAARRGP